MKNYKKLVCEHYGTTIDYDSSMPHQNVHWQTLNTADSYSIYNRYDGSSSIFFDEDIYYYAENCGDAIEADIKEGLRIYLDEEIAEACGLEEDGYRWEEIYHEFYEHDEEIAE